MADGLFKSLYDNYREYRRTLRRHHVSGLIDPDLFDEPFYYIEMVKHCCDMLINPRIKWKGCYPEPSYYQRLAKRIMKCIDEWDYENEMESYKEEIKGLEKYIRENPFKRTEPDWKVASLRDLAYLYATCPEEKLRNGDKAVALACKAYELTNYQDRNIEDFYNIVDFYNYCDIVDVLAAAYAECGDFDKAIEYQKKAIKLVEDYQHGDAYESGSRSVAYKEHLAAYKQKKPWRQKRT